MHLVARGVVLREVNYKESDKILTVLTDEGGKRTVKARGCRRKAVSYTHLDLTSLRSAAPAPAPRWAAFCAATGFPLEALPVERSLKRAVLHPEADAIRRLALSGGEIAALGLRGEEIGAAQKQLAAHILSCPGDNTRERLLELLEGTGDGCKTL